MEQLSYSDAFDTLLGQSFCFSTVWIASNATKGKFLGGFWITKDGFDDGATLVASGTEDDEDLLCRHGD